MAAAAAALLFLPAPAPAAPTVSDEFTVDAQPGQLTRGPDGNVWVALDGVTFDLARVTPGGTVTEFTTANVTNPKGIAVGPDGGLWVTQTGGVARIDPATPETAQAVPIALLTDPRGIVSDGTQLWAASGDRIFRISTAGTVQSFVVQGLAGARGIARGGDGFLYVADFANQRIVRIDPADPAGATGLFSTGPNGNPMEVAPGPNGQIGFTVPSDAIGRLDPGGTPSLTTVQGADPTGIAFADDGAYWTANFAAGTLSRLTPAGALSPLDGLSPGSGPRYITAGAGTLWVSLETARRIARVTGVVAETPSAPAPTPPMSPPSTETSTPAPAPTVTPDRTAPRLSAVSFVKRLTAGRRGTLRLVSSERGTVEVTVERRLAGRRVGRRCVASTRRLRSRPACARHRRLGAVTRSVPEGRSTLTVGPSLGRRKLAPGRYRLRVVVVDGAGNRSRAAGTTVQVVERSRR